MFQIIRFLFWAFVLSQMLLLIFSDSFHRRTSASYLNVALVCKIGLVLAYFIYTCPKLSFHSDWFLHLIGFVFIVWLLFMVWRAYLSKSLDKEKVYQMTDLSKDIGKVSPSSYAVFGTIKEKKNTFSVCLRLDEETFMKLSSQGYFDEHSQKPLNVELTDEKPTTNECVDIIVRLSLS